MMGGFWLIMIEEKGRIFLAEIFNMREIGKFEVC
jgi:hypothetical protein